MNNQMRMTSNNLEVLKYIAVVLMFLDHFAAFYTEYFFLRHLGRLVYPIFAFIMVYNYIYNTYNKEKYIQRVLVWGILAQGICHYALLNTGPLYLNILFTLGLGLSLIHSIETKDKTILILSTIALVFLSKWIMYGFVGVFLMPVIYITLKYQLKTGYLVQGVMLLFLNSIHFLFSTIFVLPFIWIISKINFPEIKRIKGFYFYLFYPLHLLILKFIYDFTSL